MSDKEIPQIYLITPANTDITFYTETLAPLLDICPVACIRLGLSSDDESPRRIQATGQISKSGANVSV